MARRNRQSNVTTTHAAINHVADLLTKIGSHPDVTAVHTGTYRFVKSSGSSTQPTLKLRRRIPAGLELVAKRSDAIQEIRVVTCEPERVLEYLRAEGLLVS